MNIFNLETVERIAELEAHHYEQVASIYRKGIATGNATFETNVPDWANWDKSHMSAGRFVLLIDKKVAGWAALTPVSGRCVYSGVAEISIYVDPDFKRRGIGQKLLQVLIDTADMEGIWTLQAGILKENIASIALHKKCGFREVGYREKLGKLNGQWRDVYLFERRNTLI